MPKDSVVQVAIEIDGSRNVIKDNILLPGESFSTLTGMQFLQDGNFYGDNLLVSDVFLGGTVQTDLGGNVVL